MDRELQQKSTSRDFDGIGDGEEGDRRNNSHALRENDRDLAENAHVLSNILQSLEASAGEAGPVPNMLKGMGARKSE